MVRKLVCGFVCLAAMAASSAFATGVLPYGYTEVEYVKGNGSNCRIVSDYTPNPTTDKIEAVVEFASNPTADQLVWCARGNGDTTKTWSLYVLKDTTDNLYKFRFDYNSTAGTVCTPAVSAGTKYTVTVDRNEFTWSGGEGQTHDAADDFTAAGGPLVLFMGYRSKPTSNIGNYGQFRLYSFKVWRSGELIHYFVPCKDSDDMATLVDICDNPATLTAIGGFTAGNEGHFFDDSFFPLVILPIPNQCYEAGQPLRPEFSVLDKTSSRTWTIGGDISSDIFDVEYTDNVDRGVASVTVTGKGEFAGKQIFRTFLISGDEYLATGDPYFSRLMVDDGFVYVFTNSVVGRQTITARQGIFVSDALLVGGGGSGGTTSGGGGGAGGVLDVGVYTMFPAGGTFQLSVGVGGIGMVGGGHGNNGGDTTLSFGGKTYTAFGGGGGGCNANGGGYAGGSGGGAGYYGGGVGGAGVAGQGHAGGHGGIPNATGYANGGNAGGGGAGHEGYSHDAENNHAGDGGEGVMRDITGEEVWYGGGGGAMGSTGGTGGVGGGGNGGSGNSSNGGAGTDGLGGGGGGGASAAYGTNSGGRGGKGTVILVVKLSDFDIEPIPDQFPAAGGCTPTPVVRAAGGSAVLTEGVDYDVSYSGNTSPGNAAVIITGRGTYAGRVGYAGFAIVARYFAKPEVEQEGDGFSWETAMSVTNLLATVAVPDGPCEFWLAEGTATITTNCPMTVNYPVVIRGGFAGNETTLAERPEGTYTHLTGNDAKKTMEASVERGSLLTVERLRFSHSSGSEIRKTGKGDLVVRDCLFTDSIQTGQDPYGRGIYAAGGTVSVSNCQFLNMISPFAAKGGNGIYFSSCTRAYVDDCLFVTNGAAYSVNGPNWAGLRGAAVVVDATPAIFRNCRFASCCAALSSSINDIGSSGGTVVFTGASGGSKMINCTLVGNNDYESMRMGSVKSLNGGAISCGMSTTDQTLDIENCTVAYNLTLGGLMAAGINVYKGTVNLKNSIVYGNVRGKKDIADAAGADIEVGTNGVLNISYSLVTGMTTNYVGTAGGAGTINWGEGVIDVDPLLTTTTNDFVGLFKDRDTYWNLEGNDTRAACAAFDVHPRTHTGYMLDGVRIRDPENVESPTIDAGDPDSDYSLEPEVPGVGGNGHRVNLGAYGNTPEAALTKVMGFHLFVR